MGNNDLRNKVDWFNKFVVTAKTDIESFKDNLIYPTDNGYSVFGDYQLIIKEHGVEVKKTHTAIDTFSSKQIALSWCIADKFEQKTLALQIERLDERYRIAVQSLKTREHALGICLTNTDVLEAKIQQRKQQKFLIRTELEKCVKQAKYLQIRGFTNDTQRNSRIKTQKTSR